MSKVLLEKKNTTFKPPLTWQVLPGKNGIAVAVCKDIDLTFQIDDGGPDEQISQIVQAFGSLLNDLEKSGELRQFFAKYGIRVQQKIYKSDKQVMPMQEKQPTLKMSLEKLDITTGLPSSKLVHA